ncbi:unnamed protein product [Pleuronectes platessa]|uniref:Uncharacterized protein n=1 Tax=Pleuronectes platessa TaxID=8262 RepID=A0A9N7YSF8_PLEPL|nr:unnamed protein product [Pleuronectes platessa]
MDELVKSPGDGPGSNRRNGLISPQRGHLLADDLAQLVHIFKQNVVVRHRPTRAGEDRSPLPKSINAARRRPRADGQAAPAAPGSESKRRCVAVGEPELSDPFWGSPPVRPRLSAPNSLPVSEEEPSEHDGESETCPRLLLLLGRRRERSVRAQAPGWSSWSAYTEPNIPGRVTSRRLDFTLSSRRCNRQDGSSLRGKLRSPVPCAAAQRTLS